MPNTENHSTDAPPLAPAMERFHCEVVEKIGAAWDTLASGFDDMCLEQTAAFAVSRFGASRPVGLILRETGASDPIAMAIAVVAVLPVIGHGLAYVKFGPLWRRRGKPANPEILLLSLEALKQEFAVKRGLLLRILPPADPDHEAEWKAALIQSGLVLSRQFPDSERYLVNLALGEEEHIATLGLGFQRNLRKAKATKLDVCEVDLKSSIEDFLALYRGMHERKQFKDYHGIEDLPAMYALSQKSPGLRMFLAFHDKRPVAGSVIAGSGGIVSIPFSASSEEARKLRAGHALRWEIVNRLRRGEARWLDLGGAEGQESLREFKLGYVGTSGRVIDIPGEYDYAPNALSAAAARAIELGRDLARTPTLKKIVTFLPI